jgi:hypothetical protein
MFVSFDMDTDYWHSPARTPAPAAKPPPSTRRLAAAESRSSRRVHHLPCWLPLKPGLTPHGLRHSHKAWMAEDGIPEILGEQRPGARGARHARPIRARLGADARRAEGRARRWEDSLRERAAIHPHSPVPLLDRFLAPLRGETRESADPLTPREIAGEPATLGDREKMISQFPPKITADNPTTR